MATPISSRERLVLGQQRRTQVPRTAHATWNVKERRKDPLKLLEASTRGRVPKLVALKNERMALSPFGYFRGAVPVMAYDLSLVPSVGIVNQLCGDAHVRNLGAYAGVDGRLVFDINDFDETIVGPFEWDVKRMATSLVVAGREGGLKDTQCREAAGMFLEAYRTTILAFARMPVLEVARYQVHRLREVLPLAGILRKAERATPMQSLLKLTESTSAKGKRAKEKGAGKKAAPVAADGEKRRFKTVPPVLTRETPAMFKKVVASLSMYSESLLKERRHFLAQYRPIDVAFKVVGTGSVGLRDYCVYMEGNGANDPLLLQVKEEAESGYAPYLGSAGRTATRLHQGRRVVEGERAMQLQSDPFLGWTTMDGRDYLVRQLNDHKAAIEVSDLKTTGLAAYAEVCGELLARGHARSGDCCLLAGYLGTRPRFDVAVGAFAMAYADQTEADWRQLVKSMKKPAAKTRA